ncbi:MAG: hypothetical protein JJE25_01345 [Bacteroidia bacterium]|nr:hypothetical protein [Bacteroidia bacterium]
MEAIAKLNNCPTSPRKMRLVVDLIRGEQVEKALYILKFTNKEGKLDFVWATSWGVSTRLMGALVMAHSDDDGLVLPPLLAPIQVIIIPIYKNDEQAKQVIEAADKIYNELKAKNILAQVDKRDTQTPGWKFSEYEMKGVPVRIAIGPRDLENHTVEVARRDTKEKSVYQITDIALKIEHLLGQIQDNIYKKALDFRDTKTFQADTYDELKKILDTEGGFVLAHWDGTAETEAKIKEETKATIRCIPNDARNEEGKCIISGKPSHRRVVFARAY